MSGTTSSDSGRFTSPPPASPPAFRWWFLALLLGFAGTAWLAASTDTSASWWFDLGNLLLLGVAIALTGVLVVVTLVRLVRHHQRPVPSATEAEARWLPGGHGAAKWLWTAGGLLVITGATGVASVGTRGGLHRVMSAIAFTGLSSLGLVVAGLVIWLFVALGIQLTRPVPGRMTPAYPGGPDVPPEPWAYVSQKWGRPASAMLVGLFLSGAPVVFAIYTYPDAGDDESRSALDLVLIFFGSPLFAGGVFVIWTALRRMVWASRFKKVVGCSPWSKKLKELRARGDRNDTADV